jgi:hypothetical protein
LLLGAGYRYASLAQVDTWGRAGIPYLEVNAFRWKGMDGTTILSTPKNSLFGYSPDLIKLATSEAFKKLQALGKPLLFTWQEFGWEPPDQPSYLKTSEKYAHDRQSQFPVEFVTLKDYLDRHGSVAAQGTRLFPHGRLEQAADLGFGRRPTAHHGPQGGGNACMAAERFDAIAAQSWARKTTRAHWRKAWKHLLASQSHDVGLCEHSRWQADRMAPLDRLEDQHNFTWGAIGYNHLDAAEEQGTGGVNRIARHHCRPQWIAEGGETRRSLRSRCSTPAPGSGPAMATTGRIYPIR